MRDVAIKKYRLLGAPIAATNYEAVVEFVEQRSRERIASTITALDAHGLSKSKFDSDFSSLLNRLDIVTPDGHSLKWGLRLIYGVKLPDRLAGPDLMLDICERFAQKSMRVYLYGSYPHVVENLKVRLKELFPGLQIVGARPSRFRAPTPEEDVDDILSIRDSGADVVFVGLGCPLQEKWIDEHKAAINCPLIAVGAAFDFHSGNKRRAPRWMRDSGLEWVFRIWVEPRRLLVRSIPAIAKTAFGLTVQWVASKWV